MAVTPKSGARAARRPSFAVWSRTFLAELSATSNVSAAARAAGVSTTTVYEARRASPTFNRAWQQALCEGYDLLEMALLQRMREGEIKPATGAKRGVRTYDNAVALRLLGAHRELVARQRAIRDHEDGEAILRSLNAKLERILRDPYTNKPYVNFYATRRVGGQVLDSDAIKLLKIAA